MQMGFDDVVLMSSPGWRSFISRDKKIKFLGGLFFVPTLKQGSIAANVFNVEGTCHRIAANVSPIVVKYSNIDRVLPYQKHQPCLTRSKHWRHLTGSIDHLCSFTLDSRQLQRSHNNLAMLASMYVYLANQLNIWLYHAMLLEWSLILSSLQ
jgi:hypothetical protein